MREEILFRMNSTYREPFEIKAYHFGGTGKTVCVIGNLRGNEIQQMYTAAALVKRLKRIEEQGLFRRNYGVTVVPTANTYSVNIGKRFWAMDNSDINRMFPGYNRGETTQRIAAGLFEKIQGYKYGIHLSSCYISGDYVTHLRIVKTPYQEAGEAQLFGLPFIVFRKPIPFDTTTLNFNWQVWDTKTFSLISRYTDKVNVKDSELEVASILRFLSRMGIIDYSIYGGFESTIFYEEELKTVRAEAPGIFLPKVDVFDEVLAGQELAQTTDAQTGEVLSSVRAEEDGILFYRKSEPLVMEHEEIFMIVPKLHR